MPWFALVDCNNFYCSCERIFDLSAEGQPVVVLSNNDGCIISRSQEAKDVGIRMGAPTFSVRDLVARHNIKVYSSNYALYGDISARVMNSLAELCPLVEVYSIDEAFLDLSIFPADELLPFAVEVRRLIRKWTKIPTCVGIGPTKTLAKIANKVAKKETSGQGVFAITDDATRRDVLSRFAVADVWGVGRRHTRRLNVEGVQTALQLAEKSDGWVREHFSIVGQRMIRELRGEACIPMLEPRTTSKHICTSRSFGVMPDSVESLSEAVATFANRIGEKLREQKACARLLTVFVCTNRFRGDLQQHNAGLTIPLLVASNDSAELIRYALIALRAIYKPGYFYKKAGVTATDIVPTDQVQSLFLNPADREKQARAATVIDQLNAHYGRNTVKFAVQGKENAYWHPKFEKRTPRYTTQWQELLKVELA